MSTGLVIIIMSMSTGLVIIIMSKAYVITHDFNFVVSSDAKEKEQAIC